MGQFSYKCRSCGGHDQFDWVTSCVVELALTTGKTIHVEGYYDGYGRAICRVGEDQQCRVYPDQFAQFFKHWNGVQITTSKIWCNGSRGCERNCVPRGTDILDRIPAESYGELQMLAGAPKSDLREPYEAAGMEEANDLAAPGMMLDAMLRGVM